MPKSPSSPPSSPSLLNYSSVAEPNVDFYEMLHLEPHCRPEQIEKALREAQRWWNGQQANPKFRHKAREALARLREARAVLFDPMRRQSYDRQRQATHHQWRKSRWQPVRELMDVLLQNSRCSHRQEQLLVRFAQRRNLTDEEIEILLNEEFLQRGIEREPEPAVVSKEQQSFWQTLGYRSIMTLMLAATGGIVVLSFNNLVTPATLLMFPLLNDIRLLVRGLYLKPSPKDEERASTNGWDWLVGVAVLGGATATSLSVMQRHSLFPLGVTVAALLWLAWLWLVVLWSKTSPDEPPNV